jgi:hydrogenase nickel incorporation protein HypB
MEYFRQGVEILNPNLITFPLSCQSGEGIDHWLDWVTAQIDAKQGNR